MILGIDPGTALTGYGLVRGEGDDLGLEGYGAISTTPDWPLPRRLQHIYRQLRTLIEAQRPTAVAVEEVFFSRNARTALAVGQARGVALLAAAESGLLVYEYTPLQVKQAVTGYGRATKEQIQQMVCMLLNLDFVPQPDDAADAIAVAICHLHSVHLTTLLEGR